MCNKKEEISCGKVVAFPNSKFWNNNLCYRHSLEGTPNFFQLMAFLRNVLQGDDDSELYFELVKTFCVEGES